MHPRVIANALGAVYAAGGAAMLVPTLYALLSRDGNAVTFTVPALALGGELRPLLQGRQRPASRALTS